MQWMRSLLFNLQMYVAMPIIGLFYLPYALISPAGAHAGCHAYSRWVIWTLRWMVGLKIEIRGTPPTDEVLVAAKHQSFLDIMVIYNAMPRGKFIMKKQIMYMPVIGQFALRIGCVPVDRGKRGAAIKKMLDDVRAGRVQPGQLIIYPQGTRVAPGVSLPYKQGSAALYEQLKQPCVPVATNIGVFWPKRGITRHPGTAVVDFLPRIEPGMDKVAFLAHLETQIETASDALSTEAGFTGITHEEN